jgi:hypothetical protein
MCAPAANAAFMRVRSPLRASTVLLSAKVRTM